ncbi:helix-turn-helix domain-containing protein [Modestobacter sp. VKM Ac-2985]|uniref:helix-turn-helix domain-containing protein n=1 Tax=Modestobacter sp. VKM Ac-2985 TaxID=3004139 RepID=UPI0022ABAFB1|nr:helix-turn-helix domain-containing protein [Modestobacter sp. VKM Ac-2985]MCZ2837094.1 helix-turn-helix domain-containing protein [Modestobacter sp. VKM Ac-2985]
MSPSNTTPARDDGIALVPAAPQSEATDYVTTIPDPAPTDVLSDREAHNYLRLRPGTLARMRMERRGPAWSYVGRRVVYLRVDLLAYLAANRVNPVGQL